MQKKVALLLLLVAIAAFGTVPGDQTVFITREVVGRNDPFRPAGFYYQVYELFIENKRRAFDSFLQFNLDVDILPQPAVLAGAPLKFGPVIFGIQKGTGKLVQIAKQDPLKLAIDEITLGAPAEAVGAFEPLKVVVAHRGGGLITYDVTGTEESLAPRGWMPFVSGEKVLRVRRKSQTQVAVLTTHRIASVDFTTKPKPILVDHIEFSRQSVSGTHVSHPVDFMIRRSGVWVQDNPQGGSASTNLFFFGLNNSPSSDSMLYSMTDKPELISLVDMHPKTNKLIIRDNENGLELPANASEKSVPHLLAFGVGTLNGDTGNMEIVDEILWVDAPQTGANWFPNRHIEFFEPIFGERPYVISPINFLNPSTQRDIACALAYDLSQDAAFKAQCGENYDSIPIELFARVLNQRRNSVFLFDKIRTDDLYDEMKRLGLERQSSQLKVVDSGRKIDIREVADLIWRSLSCLANFDQPLL